MTPVSVNRGNSAVILAFPHSGTFLPADVAENLNGTGHLLSDTDWHLPRLYADLLPDATAVTAHFHRYVIDANRDPSGQSLYPGQATTGLVPETDFDGNPIRHSAPSDAEIARLQAEYHQPYHDALAAEIARVRDQFGHAILYDCHSIRSYIPRLFEGTLPDLNVGTFEGASCAPQISDLVGKICDAAPGYSSVLNGRFKGGWTTRHYGRPKSGIHAVQMELAQVTHLKTETAPWDYDAPKAEALRNVLRDVLQALRTWRPA